MHSSSIISIGFNQDGTILATGADDKKFKL